jgi:hypothetical protein
MKRLSHLQQCMITDMKSVQGRRGSRSSNRSNGGGKPKKDHN